MNSEEKTPSIETLQRTIDACAWLIDIAQHSVDHHGLPSVVVQYIEALGSGAYPARIDPYSYHVKRNPSMLDTGMQGVAA